MQVLLQELGVRRACENATSVILGLVCSEGWVQRTRGGGGGKSVGNAAGNVAGGCGEVQTEQSEHVPVALCQFRLGSHLRKRTDLSCVIANQANPCC